MNKVELLGNLGNQPEVRYTSSGRPVCNFSVATNERYKKADGETVERTEWHRITVWGKLAQVCGEHLSKGRQVLVEGQLRTRKWEDRDGNARYTTEVLAQRVKFLGGAKGKSSESDASDDDYSLDSDSDTPF